MEGDHKMDVFYAVADPTRRSILDILSRSPLTAGEIGMHFSNITQPGMSKHLRVLRKVNLVSVSVNAQKRIYSLNRDGFTEIELWISKYQKFWNNNLDSLGNFLDSKKEEQNDRS